MTPTVASGPTQQQPGAGSISIFILNFMLSIFLSIMFGWKLWVANQNAWINCVNFTMWIVYRIGPWLLWLLFNPPNWKGPLSCNCFYSNWICCTLGRKAFQLCVVVVVVVVVAVVGVGGCQQNWSEQTNKNIINVNWGSGWSRKGI